MGLKDNRNGWNGFQLQLWDGLLKLNIISIRCDVKDFRIWLFLKLNLCLWFVDRIQFNNKNRKVQHPHSTSVLQKLETFQWRRRLLIQIQVSDSYSSWWVIHGSRIRLRTSAILAKNFTKYPARRTFLRLVVVASHKVRTSFEEFMVLF